MDIDFIIPCLNSEKTLNACLKSIFELELAQNKIHVYVIDNGSTDKTVEIAKKFESVKVVNASPKSRSIARNVGIKASHSEFIAFIDSDVILDKNWLIEIMKVFKSPMIGGSQGGIIPKGEESHLNRFRYQRKKASTRNSFNSLEFTYNLPLINTASCMYRRKALDLVNGFDESYANEDRCEDLDLCVRISIAGYSYAAANNALSYVFFTEGLLGYLKRTFFQAYSHYKLTRSRYGASLVGDLKNICISSLNIPKGFFWLSLVNNFVFTLGFLWATLRVRSIRSPNPWKKSKVNFTFPILKLDTRNFRFSLNHRIVLGGASFKILGPRTIYPLRYQLPSQIDFMKQCLFDTKEVVSCTNEDVRSMLNELIEDKVLLEV